MNKIVTVIIILCSSAIGYSQTEKLAKELNWVSDINQAYELSKAENKPIFAFFTGSDWCGWCHKLQREVFAKTDFINWANDNVILLELDFPRKKQLPEQIAAQNQSLQQFFKVSGFPTIWVFNMNKDPEMKTFQIAAFGSLGYPSGAVSGKEELKFLENAKNVLNK